MRKDVNLRRPWRVWVAVLIGFAVGITICRADLYWVGTGTWSTAANWALTSGGGGGAGVPGDGTNVFFDSYGGPSTNDAASSATIQSLTLTSAYTSTNTQNRSLMVSGDCLFYGGAWRFTAGTAADLTIGTNMVVSNATVYCQYSSVGGSGTGRTFSVGGAFALASNGVLNADGLGFPLAQGPGKSTGDARHGGAYGGQGGSAGYPYYNFSGSGGTTYGLIVSPTDLGSGGGQSPGGGSIILDVEGSTVIDGTITAKGSGGNTSGGSGSGGGVYIMTPIISGSGAIVANGGNCVYDDHASGGGGRIAIVLGTGTEFGTINLQAFGGSSGRRGAAGTIYLQKSTDTSGQGELVVDNSNRVTWVSTTTLQQGTGSSSNCFARVTLRRSGVFCLDSNDILNITNTSFTGDSGNRLSGLYLNGGTLLTPGTFGWTNFFIGLGATNCIFSPTNVIIGSNATLLLDKPYTLDCPITVLSNGWISHSANLDTEVYKINLVLNGDLNIQTGGQINVDAKGLIAGGYGTGKPVGAAHNGCGHGGEGGTAEQPRWLGRGGTTYGSVITPTNMGSSSASAGGGAVILNITGAATVNGTISANGGNISGGAGSGGSVYLTAPTLAGSGTIRADGGACQFPDQASGGGGRIAVVVTSGPDKGNVAMHAASGAGPRYGAAGTVYLRVAGQGTNAGVLRVDNLGISSDVARTLISSNVTDAVVGTVIITNSASLALGTNQTLTVNGSWLNYGTFTAATNSSVIFAGSGQATVLGNNTFYNFYSTVLGRAFVFEAGKTNTVQGGLVIRDATLNSTVNNTYWYLTLATGATQALARVVVRDSNAGLGLPILARSASWSSGHNVNWQFLGGTVILLQ